ncbi:MAG TPA: copper resistance protein CopC [Ktedonobacteraceae bacterium]|jgi:methionine-rich copper-binding protein CopC
MPRRRLLATGIALILSILTYISTVALIQPSVASAHAYVIGSDPVDGSTVATVPKEVHIYFNAPVSPLSSAHVYFIQGGNFIDVGATPSQVAPLNTQELVIPVKTPSAQHEGGYEVIWNAVANNDGHTTEGIIGFNVGFSPLAGFSGTPILGPSTSNDLEDIHTLDLTALLSILWEWLVFVALTAWIGILVMEQFVLIDHGRGIALLAQVRKQTYSLQRVCLATLLFGECVALLLRVIHLAQVQHSDNFPLALSLSMITETNYGHIWLLRMVLIALIMGLQYWTHQSKKQRSIAELAQSTTQSDSQDPQPIEEAQTTDTNQTDDTGKLKEPAEVTPALSLFNHRVAWLVLAGLLTLLFVLTSPAAQVLQPHLSAILFEWLQNAALGIWFGCFAYLGYALLPLLRTKNRDDNAETLVILLQRLTPVLLISISIQLISLFFLSEASIHDPQQLRYDPYGLSLAVQLIIIAISVLLSAYILFVLRPSIIHEAVAKSEVVDRPARQSALNRAEHRLKITTSILSVLGISALLCAALMSFFAPPIVFPDVTYTNQLESPTNSVDTQTRQIGTFSVTLELLPGHIDQSNTVIILIKDRNGKPVTDAQVQLTLSMQIMDMGTEHVLITGGNPVYATTIDPHRSLSMAGLWNINVEIQRSNQQAVQDTFQVMLS